MKALPGFSWASLRTLSSSRLPMKPVILDLPELNSTKPRRVLSSLDLSSRVLSSLRQQQLQILPAQARQHAPIRLDDGVGEVSLALLELENLLLDGVAGHQTAGEDGTALADAVGAVDGLGLDGGVPPGIEEVDVVGGGEVQAQPPRLEADQEELAGGVGLERLHLLAQFPERCHPLEGSCHPLEGSCQRPTLLP